MRRLLAAGLSLGLISGCGLFGFGQPTESGSAKLIPFSSEKELRDYFTGQVQARNGQYSEMSFNRDEDGAGGAAPPNADSNTTNGAAPGGEAQDSSPETPDFSNTTIQEEGVDESDVVKTDGQYLYVMSSGASGSVLRIVRATPPDAMAQVGQVELDGYGSELYLMDADDAVVALSQTGGGYFYVDPLPADGDVALLAPDIIGGSYAYERPRTVITVIDVSAPDAPRVTSETAFDGSPASSRIIDGVLHLVLANYPEYYFDVMPMLGRPELDVSNVQTADVLPNYRREGADGGVTEGPVVTYENLYRPTDADGFGVVTIVSLDVQADAEFTSVGVVAAPGLIYSSLEAMFLTDTQYTFDGTTRETTDIYKFAYVDRGATPAAAGTVPGRVLNQYSMSEYEGRLRVATTVGPTWGIFGPITNSANNVYVMSQNGETLETMGSIENIAPGETIQACRFVGAKGFLVTFEQIDPLFTIDLSDPANPSLIGELKIPGFSTFLVPIDENHMLAVGQYIPEGGFFGWGVELSVFDVSDFANPQRTAHVVLGEQGGAYSEALYNPKALTYFKEQGLVAIPVTEYNNGPIWVFDATGGAEGGVAVGRADSGGWIDAGVSQSSDGSAGVLSSVGCAGDAGVTDVTVAQTEPDAPPPDSGVADEPIDGTDVFEPQGFEGLVVFSVSADAGFAELGRISTQFNSSAYYWTSFTRGVFIGEDVFAVTDRGVRAAPVADLASTPFEVAFPVDDYPPGVVEPVGVTEPAGGNGSPGSTEPAPDGTVTSTGK